MHISKESIPRGAMSTVADRDDDPDAALRWRASRLEHVFSPGRIAVIGASGTRGKWSNDVFRLLAQSFTGEVIPVNPRREVVEGLATYPSIDRIPGCVDLAIVVVPREDVPGVAGKCADANIPVVQVLSSGFGEVRGDGAELHQRLMETIAHSDTVLIGPNAMGVYSAAPCITFADNCHFKPGPLAFVSQSGGLCYDVLMRGQARGLNFGKILSVGNCADLDWPEFIHYLGRDPEIEAFALYIESVSDGRRLFETLREAARGKPVFVLKGGKTGRGGQSVASHTGRLAGDYEIWQAMLRQARVTEVDSLDDLLIALEAVGLARNTEAPRPPRHQFGTMIIGMGGGATVLVADACEHAGVTLAPLSDSTRQSLEQSVPGAAAFGGAENPLEIGADRMLREPDLLARLTATACTDPSVSAVLIHLNLIAMSNVADSMEAWKTTCEHLAEVSRGGRIITLVLRNGDGGDMPEALQRCATGILRHEPSISVFTHFTDALSLISRVADHATEQSPGETR